jgi:hypothetical protein
MLSLGLRVRGKAFALHLGGSMIVIGLFLLLLRQVWYPGPYFAMESTWEVIKVAVGVDLVIGPMLTLIVFDYRKPARLLRLDMTVIILLQLTALSWGIWNTYVAHPAYLVYSQGQFYTVDAGEADVSRVSVPSLATSAFSRPRVVYALPPRDDAEKAALFTAFFSGKKKDIPYLAERYRPLHEHLAAIQKMAEVNAKYLGENSRKQQVVNAWLKEQGRPMAEYGFFTVFGHKKEGVVVLRRDSGALVGYLDLIL